ncbi:hypothetical protein RM549_07100 [Salegentibacter sp. F188]|uniref:Alpha/beta hydrolase n=1 Tax=Autumnicola patrickiae TaxID=3075591 RepID=A0ABU3E0V4_9FLAO|nr:hypothetical protein [Salegentibacter sp. F188]MDT0689545.1 hypothetical protein [Salegentibacter sp. F188]
MKKQNYCVFLLLIFVFSFAGAQELRLIKGRVTDSIPVQDSLGGSYALYVPQSFEAEKANPIIFVFDPEGRGRLAAQLFRGVAEEHSYVIASSNVNMEQDSLQENVTQALRMIGSVVKTIPIETDEIFAAGLNEGAQVASALPLIYSDIDGVLAIGNAVLNPDFVVEKNTFMFSAIVSELDYQKFQMESYVDFFEDRGFPAELNYYSDSPEKWPDTQVINSAVAGFVLNAMERGSRDRDAAVVESLFQNGLEHAESLRRKREYYPAYVKLEQMEEKYQDYNFDDILKERKRDLRRTRAFKKQRRESRRVKAREEIKQQDYIYFLENDLAIANFENIGWWAYQLDELKELQEKGSGVEQKMAHRLEGFLKSYSKVKYDDIQRSNAHLDVRIFASLLRTVLDKENPEPYLNIVKLAGQDGDYETALLYLEDLLKLGFDDMEALYNIPGILDLKLSPEYNELIQQYLGESKYYQAELLD